MFRNTLTIAAVIASTCAGLAGLQVAYFAHEYLVDEYRIVASIGTTLLSLGLIASAMFLARQARFAQGAAMCFAVGLFVYLVAGLSRMGSVPLAEAFFQATCARGFAMCFNHVATAVNMLTVLVAILLVMMAISRVSRQSND